MKIPRTVTLAAIVVLALALSAGALAQDGLLTGLIQPQVVNIEQQVPVTVTLLLPMEDGTVVTTTAPITVGIALQVKIDGTGVTSVVAGEAAPAVVSAHETTEGDGQSSAVTESPSGQLVDLEGIPYTVEAAKDIAILQIRSKESLGMTSLVGELQNNGRQTAKYVALTVKFYDADGNLLDVGSGAATSPEIEPGGTSAFRVISSVEPTDVASYAIEIR